MKKISMAVFSLALILTAHAQNDTAYIKSLRHFKEGKVNYLITPSGKKIEVSQVPKTAEEPEAITTDPARSNAPAAARALKRYVNPNLTAQDKTKIKANECKNEKFAGLSRSAVKTRIAVNNSFSYQSLAAFLNTLPNDEDMDDVVDALDEPWRERSIQETKNVTISNVFLLAYAREDDNDYHLILTNSTKTVFFNAELSGLPATAITGYQTLKKVRQKFETFPGAVKCGKYTILQTPLRIKKIKGSIFFDTDHPAGTIGPGEFKPKTAWEIHPITDIVFE